MRQEWPIKPSWIIPFFRPMACERVHGLITNLVGPMVNLERFLSRWINRWIGEFYFQRNPGKKILLNIPTTVYSFPVSFPVLSTIRYRLLFDSWKPSDIIFILFHVIDNIFYCISKFASCNVSRSIRSFHAFSSYFFFSLHCPRSRTICLNSSRTFYPNDFFFFLAYSNTDRISKRYIYIFLPSRKSRILLFSYRRFCAHHTFVMIRPSSSSWR